MIQAMYNPITGQTCESVEMPYTVRQPRYKKYKNKMNDKLLFSKNVAQQHRDRESQSTTAKKTQETRAMHTRKQPYTIDNAYIDSRSISVEVKSRNDKKRGRQLARQQQRKAKQIIQNIDSNEQPTQVLSVAIRPHIIKIINPNMAKTVEVPFLMLDVVNQARGSK